MIETTTGHPSDTRRDLRDLHALVATALDGADRRQQVGLVASMAMLFAATAREHLDIGWAACGAGG